MADDLRGPQGEPLPAVGPNALAFDPERAQLYVARSSDNAVSVLDADSLALLGSFPVAWYPDDLAVAPDGHVVVANMKGYGSGPNLDDSSPPGLVRGTVSIVDPAELDLTLTSQQVEDNLRRTDDVYPFDCDGRFHVPTRWGEPSQDATTTASTTVEARPTPEPTIGDWQERLAGGIRMPEQE